MQSPFYTRVAAFGLVIYLSFVVLLLVFSLVLQRSEWEYPIIVGAIGSSLLAVVYLWRPWGLVVGVLAGLFAIPFSLDDVAANLSSPESFLDFAYRPVFALAGTLLLLGGSATGLVQHFRHRTSFEGPRPAVVAIAGLLCVVGVLSVFSLVVTFTSVDSVSADEKAGAARLTAEDFKFEPRTIEATLDDGAKILVRNRDYVVHNLTVDALGVDLKVGPRSEKLADLSSAAPGTYDFHCDITGHESMKGTLTVK